MKTNNLKDFDKEYNTDGCGKALVIIENNETGGTTQRPAHNEIKTYIIKREKALLKELADKVGGIDFYGWDKNTQKLIKERVLKIIKDKN